MTAQVVRGGLPIAEDPTPANERLRLLVLAGVPLLLFNLGAPYLGLIGVPMFFFLKNRLHLTPPQTSLFALAVSAPVILAFVFGFIRDRWSPRGAGDRGHLIVFGLAAAAAYLALAFLPPTYLTLMIGGVLLTTFVQFISGAAHGLAASVGRRHAMTGQMSTTITLAATGAAVSSQFLGGMLSDALEKTTAAVMVRTVFLVGAALMAASAAFGAFGPAALLDDVPRPPARAPLGADISRLVKYWPIYPALLVQMMWEFAPSVGTALQFHMSRDLHATDAQVGAFQAIVQAGFIPVVVVYAFLAQRIRFRILLWAGASIGVAQMSSLLFVHTAEGALMAAVPIGLLGGLAQGAFVDLVLRSCPKGLEGTMIMLMVSSAVIATRMGDLWGANLYAHQGGFQTTILATMAVYAAILPVLLLVPKSVSATKDARG